MLLFSGVLLLYWMPIELHRFASIAGGNLTIVPCEVQLHIFSVDFAVPYILESGSVNIADRQRRIFTPAAVHVSICLDVDKAEQ